MASYDPSSQSLGTQKRIHAGTTASTPTRFRPKLSLCMKIYCFHLHMLSFGITAESSQQLTGVA